MPRYPKLIPGQKISGIPAGGWNAAMEVAQAFKEGRLDPRAKDGLPIIAPTNLGLDAFNDFTPSDGTVEQYSLQVFDALTNSGETDFLLNPLVESENYDDDYRFNAGAVMHRSTGVISGSNDVIRLYSAGIVPAIIYVHDASHRFVDAPYMTVNPDGSGGPIQSKYWESDWDGPHQILWKESGAGEKKALLRLGQNSPRLLLGQATEAWRKRGGIPSQAGTWAYVNVGLIDYSDSDIGYESGKVVKVLLPTNASQDPNIIAGQVIGFQKCLGRAELGFTPISPIYRYVAVTPNYLSGFVGETKTVFGTWSCPGWVLADGSQDDEKTLSGEAVDMTDRFLFYNKDADQTGGNNTATFLSKDVIDNIAAHPDHVHGQEALGGQAGEGGPDPGTVPDINTEAGGAAGHAAIDDEHEIEIDVRPSWQGARLYERIDNSAGDEE